MPSFFKKPSSDKNFFQNYSDHIDALEIKFIKKFNELKKPKNRGKIFDILADEALGRINIFEPLRDGHDYCDEFVGATALPALGLIASLAFAGKALFEAGEALFIKVGFSQKDGEDHLSKAGFALALSAISFALSIASFIKSAISLVTRPIATLFSGYAPQKEDRFYRNDGVDRLISFGEETLDEAERGLSNLFSF
ncbi:hypothetical protein [Legionella waltersii]|uniref:Uncharacterized protein n=1 Tax=Legionella waltersii TaxID=66969 RepID=A0A0W1A778_9GAMM|nr:hypothetical protein [Legionella waltersii]KTD77181.1 hypothetical protein Lwal_1958 [Legionella waltersii]SNV11328.1 Uncharacterised protein [Legionella waltersii]